MITFGIATWNEGGTIGKVLDIILNEKLSQKFEIIVVAGGNSIPVVKNYAKKHKIIGFLEEKDKSGKPSALNKIFELAKGEFIILTDGDVFPKEGFTNALLNGFSNAKIGAVTGRPVSLNSRETMLGFWQHFLTDVGGHERRLMANKSGVMLVSGYLYALRAGLIKDIPLDSLADDAVISYLLLQKGYLIGYAPDAVVEVKYPTTLKDWIKQKKRTIAGHHQTASWFKTKEWRSFSKEASGFFEGFRYAKSPKELLWFFALAFFRAYVWLLSFYELYILRKSFEKIWRPVQTTK
jgi:cellulose synthase/poly-beta-1,6-N-acetylglucosamine synthase-like glycosyltransferase